MAAVQRTKSFFKFRMQLAVPDLNMHFWEAEGIDRWNRTGCACAACQHMRTFVLCTAHLNDGDQRLLVLAQHT